MQVGRETRDVRASMGLVPKEVVEVVANVPMSMSKPVLVVAIVIQVWMVVVKVIAFVWLFLLALATCSIIYNIPHIYYILCMSTPTRTPTRRQTRINSPPPLDRRRRRSPIPRSALWTDPSNPPFGDNEPTTNGTRRRLSFTEQMITPPIEIPLIRLIDVKFVKKRDTTKAHMEKHTHNRRHGGSRRRRTLRHRRK